MQLSDCNISLQNMSKYFRTSALLLIPLVAACTSPNITMTVSDAKDGRPIEGAYAIFTASAYNGNLTGHGHGKATLFLVEAVSDKQGQLAFPPQDMFFTPFSLNTLYSSANIVIFKPGYSVAIVGNDLGSPANHNQAMTWDHNNRNIPLKNANGKKEISDAIYWAQEFSWESYNAGKPCSWKLIPRILVAIEIEAAKRNKRQLPTDVDYSNSWKEGPISILRRDAKKHIQQDCGSPDDFFKPYLSGTETSREP